MLDRLKLQEYRNLYKAKFSAWFEGENHDGERYKWEAVQWFQENWRDDVAAEEFPSMLQASLLQTEGLLAADHFFPRSMIHSLAVARPGDVQAMFRDLFDEDRDVIGRIEAFRSKADRLLQEVGGEGRSHDQTENAITTYLWLRYPDRYYIYRYDVVRAAAEALGGGYSFRKGEDPENLRSFLALYDDICGQLAEDEELVSMLRDHLDRKCYPDPRLKTLTTDFCLFVSRLALERGASGGENWIQPEYTPGFSVEQWGRLLEDSDVFTSKAKRVVRRLLDCGGEASCVQMAGRYGGSWNFYNVTISKLGSRIHQHSGCPAPQRDRMGPNWWLIPVQGRRARKDEQGSYIFRLRPELKEALKHVDLSGIPLYEPGAGKAPVQTQPKQAFWWLTLPGEDVVCTLEGESGREGDGEGQPEARDGDPVVIFTGGSVEKLTSMGRISLQPGGRGGCVVRTEQLQVPLDLERARACLSPKTAEGILSGGRLLSLTEPEYSALVREIRRANPSSARIRREPYTREDFLREVYLEEAKYDRLVRLLERRRNIILQGAPGTGKTYAARRLAWSILGEKNEEQVELVQFHQSYAYEDFVMGYRPDGEGFHLKPGVFFSFCEKAARRPEEKFFFLIDEINRGNLSRIFGELLMLIEGDYRDTSVTLSANGMPFAVPGNVYLIGMMNTADRSLAVIDYALRRRFSFVDMEPGFETEGFVRYRRNLNHPGLDALVEKVQELNREIREDRSLGSGCMIGHSWFCGCSACTEEWLESIVRFDIVPTLREYWFDDPDRVERWERDLLGALS